MLVNESDQIKAKIFKVAKCEGIRRDKHKYPVTFSSWGEIEAFLIEKTLTLKKSKEFLTCFIEIIFEDGFCFKSKVKVANDSKKKAKLSKYLSQEMHDCLKNGKSPQKKRRAKYVLEKYCFDYETYFSNEALRLDIMAELDRKLNKKLQFLEECSHHGKEEVTPTTTLRNSLNSISFAFDQIITLSRKNTADARQIRKDLGALFNKDIDSLENDLAKYLDELKKGGMPCPYPTFDEGEVISLDYEGEDFEEIHGAVFQIDERINAKFLKWDHKKDVPFGYELHVAKDNGEVKVIDEKKIHFVSRINSASKTEFEPIREARRPEFK